jgi:hypothetical protein
MDDSGDDEVDANETHYLRHGKEWNGFGASGSLDRLFRIHIISDAFSVVVGLTRTEWLSVRYHRDNDFLIPRS